MKIQEIRDVIDAANWTRRDLTGGTREEFRRQQVGPALERHIEQLAALQIPPRFARDIAQRDWEIEACRSVIARWIAAREDAVRLGKPRLDFVNCRGE